MSPILPVRQVQRPDPDMPGTPSVCPVCGAMVEVQKFGSKTGGSCLSGGYAHYYQAQYGHLERWFTSGEGNLREPVISAMNCAA